MPWYLLKLRLSINSVRIDGSKMIEDAKQMVALQPGGTMGNVRNGNGIGIITIREFIICVISDKQSKEKMDILRAVGAK
jgi:cystathionine beta-synthase